MQDSYFIEYDSQTKDKVATRFNLSVKQLNVLLFAYDHVCVIGGLLFRSEIQLDDIKYHDGKNYSPLPRIMRRVIEKIPKNDFHKFFSPFKFSLFFEKFVENVFKMELRNSRDILGQGVICYKKSSSIIFENTFSS